MIHCTREHYETLLNIASPRSGCCAVMQLMPSPKGQRP